MVNEMQKDQKKTQPLNQQAKAVEAPTEGDTRGDEGKSHNPLILDTQLNARRTMAEQKLLGGPNCFWALNSDGIVWQINPNSGRASPLIKLHQLTENGRHLILQELLEQWYECVPCSEEQLDALYRSEIDLTI